MKPAFSANDHSLGQLFEEHQRNPGNAELHHLLCLGLNFRGFYHQCIEVARSGLQKHAFHPNIYLEMLIAKNLTDGVDIPDLEEELEMLVRNQPGDLGHIRNLALYHFYLEDDIAAEKLLSGILDQFEVGQIDPYTFEVIAQLQLALGHLEKCLEYCDLGLAKQGCSARLVRLKGLCLLEQGKKQAGQACLEQALDLEPSFLWACHDLGNLLFESGDLPSAFAYFGRAIAINPTDSSSYFLQAEAYSELGQFNIASAELEKLILIQPTQEVLGEAYSALGVLYLEQEHFRKAKHAIEEAIIITPTSPAPYHTMGLIAQQMASVGDPVNWFDQALECDPEHVDSWLAKGSYLLSRKELEEAESCFQAAIDLDPESADAYIGLGKLAEKRNLPKNQLMYLRTAAQLSAKNPQIQKMLAEAYLANQIHSDALEVALNCLSGSSHLEFLETLVKVLNSQSFQPSPEQKASALKTLSKIPDDLLNSSQNVQLLTSIKQKLAT